MAEKWRCVFCARLVDDENCVRCEEVEDGCEWHTHYAHEKCFFVKVAQPPKNGQEREE